MKLNYSTTRLLTNVEIAYDLMTEVHREICRRTKREDNLSDYTLNVLRNLLTIDKEMNIAIEEGRLK